MRSIKPCEYVESSGMRILATSRREVSGLQRNGKRGGGCLERGGYGSERGGSKDASHIKKKHNETGVIEGDVVCSFQALPQS